MLSANLPVTIIVKFIVARHGNKAAGACAERVEDLCGSVTPHARIRQAREVGFEVVPDAYRDKTTIKFKYVYHITFWLLKNSTALLTPNE